MPVYDYVCHDCHKTFELILTLKEHEVEFGLWAASKPRYDLSRFTSLTINTRSGHNKRSSGCVRFARAFADEHIALLPGKRTFERSCSVAVAWHVCGIPQTSSHALTPLADFSGPWPAA
jgi:hypothetical protein